MQESLVAQLVEGGSRHDPRRRPGQGDASGLGHERDGATRPRVGLDDEDLGRLDGELHVDRAPHLEGFGDGPGVALDDLDHLGAEGGRRNHTGAVSRVDAGLFDVLHHRADDDVAGRVADGVDIDLDGVLQEAVDQHRSFRRQAALAAERPESGQRSHRPGQAFAVVDDLHGPAAEDVARAYEHGVADPPDDGLGIGRRRRRPAGRLGDLEAGAQGVPALPVLGQVDRSGRRAEDEAGGSWPESFKGVWPPRATMTPWTGPVACSTSRTLVTSSRVKRLEVEPVAGVVVGRDRLGVAVDHHRLEAGVAKGEAGLDAAVVKLDALTDAVRSRPEDDHLGAIAGARPHRCPHRSSSDTGCGRRTRRRRCRRS